MIAVCVYIGTRFVEFIYVRQFLTALIF